MDTQDPTRITDSPRTPVNFGRDAGRDASSRRETRDVRSDSRRSSSYPYQPSDYAAPSSSASSYDRYDGGGLQMEKLLPQNVEAEASLLGAVLIDPETLPRLASWMTPDMFYRESHRLIFRAMLATLRLGSSYAPGGERPGDLIAVTNELQRSGDLGSGAGQVEASYVSSLANQTMTSVNAEVYAQIVEETYIGRRAIRAAGEIAGMAYHHASPEELRGGVKLLLEALSQRGQERGRWLKDILGDLMEDIEARAEGRPGALMLPTGFSDIDGFIGGGEPGDLIILAARPRIGKSATAIRLMRTMLDALEERGDDGAALYLSLEMSDLRQVRRMVASYGRVHGMSLRQGFRVGESGEIDEEGIAQTFRAIAELEERYGMRARFDDARMTIESLDAAISHAVLELGVKVVIVDQLDLLQSEDKRTQRDEYERVSSAVDELKQLAMRYGIVVICLAQINRRGADGTPELEHLRSSGRIEQDADTIILLDKPSERNPEASTDPHYALLLLAWIAKARDGKTGVAPLLWLDSYTAVEPWPAEWPVPDPTGALADVLPSGVTTVAASTLSLEEQDALATPAPLYNGERVRATGEEREARYAARVGALNQSNQGDVLGGPGGGRRIEDTLAGRMRAAAERGEES